MNNIKEYLKELFKKQPRIIIGAVLILTGMIIALMPDATLTTICIVLGIASLLKGVTSLVKAKTNQAKTITSSIVFIGTAIILFIHPEFLLSVIPFIIGLCLLGYGVFALLKGKYSLIGKITSVAAIVMGLIVIISPFAFAKAVTSIIGIAIIIIGFMVIFSKSYIKLEPPSQPGDGYTEVDFTDVDD